VGISLDSLLPRIEAFGDHPQGIAAQRQFFVIESLKQSAETVTADEEGALTVQRR
jgi:hypothetical protein